MFSFIILIRHFFEAFRRGMKDRDFKGLLFLVVLLLLTGTLFYSRVEHWSWFNSLYFCITTLTTVGLGGLSPHTTLGKSFTMIYILMGIGVLFSFLNLIAHHSLEGYNDRYDEIQKMRDERRKKSG
jgi:hypothetical protein